MTTTYSYDQNGDTTGISSTTGASTTLSYDRQARLDAVKLADGTLVLMTYNAQGQRVGYSVSKNGLTSEAEQVTYRGDELAQAVISNTQRYTDTYLYDPAGAPLELIRQTKSGSTLSTARYWYVLNGHGDVVALTDVTGTVVDSYSYDLWGRLASASETVPQRLRYAGYWYDQELGWYWVSVRAYNPTLMRWLQPDPSQQDGLRTYVYVGDDPVDQTDPTGQGPGASPAQMCHLDKRYCSNAHADTNPCDVPLIGWLCDQRIPAARRKEYHQWAARLGTAGVGIIYFAQGKAAPSHVTNWQYGQSTQPQGKWGEAQARELLEQAGYQDIGEHPYHGIDGVFERMPNSRAPAAWPRFIIVEAKFEDATLSDDQMTIGWILKNLPKSIKDPVKAEEISSELRAGRVARFVVRVYRDGTITVEDLDLVESAGRQ